LRWFVTGATGFIGGRVARQLRDAGHEVRALVRTPARGAALRELGATIVPGDIRDRASMRDAVRGCDGVFHIAAWYEVGTDSAHARAINVDGTRNVLELVRELGVPKAVYTSTLAVFSDTHGRIVDESYRHEGPMLSEYERTKHEAHYDVALPMIAAGLPLVIVMPGVVYGPGDQSPMREAFAMYLRGKLPVVPRDTAYCWAHVDDVARGHVLAMDQGRIGESYILAGPRHTMVEAFELAERITGIKGPRMRAAPAMLGAMAKVTHVLEKVLPIPASYRSETLRSVAGTTYTATSAKARRELGWDARSLEEGLRETLEWELQHHGRGG
jgi:nucleoside-diphosphate-sugar epimerase